jgi:hypothetical protein
VRCHTERQKITWVVQRQTGGYCISDVEAGGIVVIMVC